MISFRTRSLLATLLLLGQLAGLLHGLQHTSRHEGAHRHHADGHAARGEGLATTPSERDGALCGACLLAATGVALVDTAHVPRAAGIARAASAVLADDPPPRHRSRPHPARGPPAALS